MSLLKSCSSLSLASRVFFLQEKLTRILGLAKVFRRGIGERMAHLFYDWLRYWLELLGVSELKEKDKKRQKREETKQNKNIKIRNLEWKWKKRNCLRLWLLVTNGPYSLPDATSSY